MTKETEAVSGASQASYTPYDQLKDKYDIIIAGPGGAGMSALFLQLQIKFSWEFNQSSNTHAHLRSVFFGTLAPLGRSSQTIANGSR
ncbi:hypothetical protein [Paenibacillus sp.]|uniref:hypothetical protein n=1 Tax=Paenibacillus sp. TaxID=58172 RepID=UPI0028AFFCAC|nr:hypothetical protein [Paenibacillus sp.]